MISLYGIVQVVVSAHLIFNVRERRGKLRKKQIGFSAE